jgi:hypothetical protein
MRLAVLGKGTGPGWQWHQRHVSWLTAVADAPPRAGRVAVGAATAVVGNPLHTGAHSLGRGWGNLPGLLRTPSVVVG